MGCCSAKPAATDAPKFGQDPLPAHATTSVEQVKLEAGVEQVNLEAAPPASTPEAETKSFVVQSKDADGQPPLSDFVAIFDNKGGMDNKPRLGIVRSGSTELVLTGNASVLEAQDLEAISLIDGESLYVAVDSLGGTHVFLLERNGGEHVAKHVARGQLPVPEGEATDSWKSPNRTNIEAARCFGEPTASIRAKADDARPVMVWDARGSKDYAGVPGPCERVWVRSAPFDPKTASVDESAMVQRELRNLGENGTWRALSSLDMAGDVVFFTAAYDGEEDGRAVDTGDVNRSGANRTAFQSLVGKWDLSTDSTSVLGRFKGMKLEGISVDGAAPGEKIRLLLASDDEALGCLVGVAQVGAVAGGEAAIEPGVAFCNIGEAASAGNAGVQVKHFGLSGLAPYVQGH
mmetsp:Transcript_27353/g.87863  ORF Transcript_27353/g.87863 Transcript_27353/m.87863 type:complete len:404 (+) Transcript_27353:93-1304(+)